ncbi:ABC transporter permease [Streptomyces sp. NPDC058955]|uniref:ABC transporter permease n=1 Tax=unclassified Streptomyces TaxID=2593676 RepID=UPI0036637C85
MATRPTTPHRFREGSYDVVRGALLSYRALFTWLNPLGYISSRIVRPIGMAIAFTSLSSHYGAGIGRMLAGSSLLAGAGAVLYGMALSVGNERSFGTLGSWLASPQNKLGTACQRALPHLADGFVGGMCTYVICCLLYGVFPLDVPTFAAILAVGVCAAAGLGMALAALALVVEDLFIGPNAAELVLMMLTGTLVPVHDLPALLRPLSEAVPLTNAMRLVDADLANAPWDAGALWTELAVGGAWFAAGSGMLLLAARRAAARTSLT